ncbi:hypothetical protein PAMC26510_25245 [Caballeronia sordidicola]|uniref:Uncharacterized protein n=1 Tax=Caballeronia sordidicola TaxID=196367 RepID=A0A242MGP0_CABSO|nr:hypothetical protein PAMC26510_25245 [Caballeronia sordidicola]
MGFRAVFDDACVGVFAAVGVCAGLLLFQSSRVMFYLTFFSAFSHYAWLHFISFSDGEKETKQRKRLPTKGT